jgi:hypothetical protein
MEGQELGVADPRFARAQPFSQKQRAHPTGAKAAALSKKGSGVRIAVVSAALLERYKKRDSTWVIDPRKGSTFQSIWDALTALCLVFVALVTPYEVGFLDMSQTALDPLWLVNRFVDLVFLVDLVLQFFTMAEVKVDGEMRWVSSPRKIARAYLVGWFPIDITSIGVASVDYIALFQSSNELSDLRVLRTLRVLRLIKLVKLLTASKIIRRYEVKVAINYAALSLFKCIVGMLLLSHWFACIWALQTSFASSKLDTWLGNNEVYCFASTSEATVDGVECLAPPVIYTASVYWAVMSITSIGYSDTGARPSTSLPPLPCAAHDLLDAHAVAGTATSRRGRRTR